jgi:hypothetical protein
MPITNIKRDWGDGLSLVRIVTTDDSDVTFAEGYLTRQASNINSINGGTFDWANTDYVLIFYSTSWSFAYPSSDRTSLIQVTGSGGNLSFTGNPVANEVAIFNSGDTVTGTVGMTYDAPNENLNVGSNTITSEGSNTINGITQIGDTNSLNFGTTQTITYLNQSGQGNTIDGSGGESSVVYTNMTQIGDFNSIYGNNNAHPDFIYQLGFDNTIAPSNANTISNLIQVGLSNQVNGSEVYNCYTFGESGSFGDNNTNNFITQSTIVGYGCSINSNNNTVTGATSIGYACSVYGNYATALGHYSIATNQGSFVISDSTSTTPETDSVADQMVLNFAGGIVLNGTFVTSVGRIDTSFIDVHPSNGDTVNVQFENFKTIINPSSSLASLTIVLPGSPSQGQTQRISFTQNIVSLTINGGGRSIAGALTSATLGQNIEYTWDNPNSTWLAS